MLIIGFIRYLVLSKRHVSYNYIKNKGVELWSDESGVAKPTDQ